jgi:putative ABC transport system ATP-binding protein
MLPLIYGDWPNAKARAEAALASVGLAERARHRPTELSGGQQQKVAIARALVTDPAILMADEPTGNLDTASSVEIIALFQQFRRQGRTIILVTHEPDIALYAERIVRLKDGLLVGDESVARPAEAAAGGRS